MKEQQAFILATVTLACLNAVTGIYHGYLIKKMEWDTMAGRPYKKIKHGWWLYAYSGFAALCYYFIGEKYGTGFNTWLFIFAFPNRKVFFDLPMNLYRFGKEGLRYISPELKNVKGLRDAFRKGKTWDWLHYIVFKENAWVYYTAYFIGVIAITILI